MRARMVIMACGLALAFIVTASPAGGQECPVAPHAGVVDCPSDTVEQRDPADPGDPARQPVQVLGNQPRGLPITGGDVLGLVAIGGTAVGAGALAIAGSRRRRTRT